MNEQTDGQQGAAPATARDCAELIYQAGGVGSWLYPEAFSDVCKLINSYAERVAAVRVAEAAKQAREALRRLEWVQNGGETWHYCPACEGVQEGLERVIPAGHESACWLAAALAALPAAADAQEGQ